MPRPMTRTNAREIALHLMFELAFSTKSAEEILEERLTLTHFRSMAQECSLYAQLPDQKQAEYIRSLVEGAHLHSPELDQYISTYAKGWSFSRIPRVIATLMRIAMFEIVYRTDIPNSAAINSALEIAKDYDEPELISFMNGILGNFVRTEFQNIPSQPSDYEEKIFALPEESEEGESTEETPEASSQESVETSDTQ